MINSKDAWGVTRHHHEDRYAMLVYAHSPRGRDGGARTLSPQYWQDDIASMDHGVG